MKRKISFSIWNLTGETSAEVVKLQGVTKGILASVSALAWFNVSPDIGGIMAIVSTVIIEMIGCISVVRNDQK